MLERFVAVLVGLDPAAGPSEAALPQAGDLAVAEGLAGAGGFLDLVVAARAQRVEHEGQAEDREAEEDPVEDY